MDHEILPDCIKRTAEAVAEGHRMAQELDAKIQEMRRERELQMAELSKALALLTQNVLSLSDAVKKTGEDNEELREIAIASRSALNILMEERKAAQERAVEARKPWQDFIWGLLGKAAWVALGIIALALYEYIKRGGV